MKRNMNNMPLDKGGGIIETQCAYKIGKGEYNVSRVFGKEKLKDILLEKISSERIIDIEKYKCYTDVEVK